MQSESVPALTVRWLITRSRIMGAIGGAIVGALVLLGYALHIDWTWRLSPGVPATHPLTAICLVLLGLGFLPTRGRPRRMRVLARLAVLTALTILLLRFARPLIGTTFLTDITPFGHIVAEQPSGSPIKVGTNAARVLTAIAVSEILRWLRWPAASQAAAFGAIGLVIVALVGYIDGVSTFRGGLAPQTVLAASFLVIATLFATPRHGFLRPLVADSEPGRLARILLGCATPLLVLIGWVMSRSMHFHGLSSVEAQTSLSYQTAAVIILTWVLVTVASTRAERIDRRRRRAEASVLAAASTDALTGLLSRDRMEQLRTPRDSNQRPPIAATLFIDLDRFRAVNEAFGHRIGDDMLVEVARRLRTVAGPHAVGRVGGDEFAIYCVGVSPREAEDMAVAVTAALGIPFKIGERRFHLTASVGVAHSETAPEADLRQAADSAMHVAKRRGGNQAMPFVSLMHSERRSQIELEQDLYEALNHQDELSLVYQPIIRLSDRRLVAVEALARWMHPQMGAIPPNRFIQVAETTGLIVPLGLKLMAAAVRQAALWRVRDHEDAPVINLNISPVQFASGDVISDLVRMLWQADLPTSAMCIEVTEGAFTDEDAIRALREARQAGFTVAMDDFGVGYSSLSQLPRLPLASVKLDRSFVLDATASSGGATMLTAIVQLAHGLGLKVVAEGVEKAEQLALVTRAGCDSVQGFIFARPMRPEEFDTWLAEIKHSAKNPVETTS
jgi:diguanylate cyclase (GGDEF)-like protein